MPAINMQYFILAASLAFIASSQVTHAQGPPPDKDGWYALFDGKTLDGWKAAEEPKAFKVEEGLIVAGGTKLTHLYYVGPIQNAKFKDFELKAEVKTRPKGNSGIIFHTEYQAKGFPDKGFEFQINNTGSDNVFRTGSIYPAKPMNRVVVKDDEWFECHLLVKGNKVVLKVNGAITMETTLPHEAKTERTLASGTLAIQGHDPGSIVYFRSIRVKPLAGEAVTPDKESKANLGRGINLGNALEAPKEGEWGVKLKAEYFKAIKKAGFATVRLPVRWTAHAAKDASYTIDAKFAERVDWAVDQALTNELNIIVNVHHYDEMDAAPDEHLPRLLGLWQQIASRYKDRPARVFFELYNEPHDKLTEAKWNAAFPKLLAAVRQTNPTRPVIIGPGQWNSIRALDKLELPQDDRNLILTVHFYDPFEFTHQGAHWAKGSEKWLGRTWTGTDAEKAAITKQLEKTAAWAKAHDRPVFLGEFGAFEKADMKSRARWTHFVAREAERLGFGWCYWEFCSGFGAYDPKAEAWREPLKAALIP